MEAVCVKSGMLLVPVAQYADELMPLESLLAPAWIFADWYVGDARSLFAAAAVVFERQ